MKTAQRSAYAASSCADDLNQLQETDAYGRNGNCMLSGVHLSTMATCGDLWSSQETDEISIDQQARTAELKNILAKIDKDSLESIQCLKHTLASIHKHMNFRAESFSGCAPPCSPRGRANATWPSNGCSARFFYNRALRKPAEKLVVDYSDSLGKYKCRKPDPETASNSSHSTTSRMGDDMTHFQQEAHKKHLHQTCSASSYFGRSPVPEKLEDVFKGLNLVKSTCRRLWIGLKRVAEEAGHYERTPALRTASEDSKQDHEGCSSLCRKFVNSIYSYVEIAEKLNNQVERLESESRKKLTEIYEEVLVRQKFKLAPWRVPVFKPSPILQRARSGPSNVSFATTRRQHLSKEPCSANMSCIPNRFELSHCSTTCTKSTMVGSHASTLSTEKPVRQALPTSDSTAEGVYVTNSAHPKTDINHIVIEKANIPVIDAHILNSNSIKLTHSNSLQNKPRPPCSKADTQNHNWNERTHRHSGKPATADYTDREEEFVRPSTKNIPFLSNAYHADEDRNQSLLRTPAEEGKGHACLHNCERGTNEHAMHANSSHARHYNQRSAGTTSNRVVVPSQFLVQPNSQTDCSVIMRYGANDPTQHAGPAYGENRSVACNPVKLNFDIVPPMCPPPEVLHTIPQHNLEDTNLQSASPVVGSRYSRKCLDLNNSPSNCNGQPKLTVRKDRPPVRGHSLSLRTLASSSHPELKGTPESCDLFSQCPLASVSCPLLPSPSAEDTGRNHTVENELLPQKLYFESLKKASVIAVQNTAERCASNVGGFAREPHNIDGSLNHFYSASSADRRWN